MTISAQTETLAAAVTPAPPPATPSAARAAVPADGARPITLTWLEQVALQTLPGEESAALSRIVALVQNTAAALAGPQGEETRLRLVSREIARLTAKAMVLETMMDQRIAKGDDAGLARAHKAWASIRRCIAALLAEHRLATTARRPIAVAVGHAENVTIRAGAR